MFTENVAFLLKCKWIMDYCIRLVVFKQGMSMNIKYDLSLVIGGRYVKGVKITPENDKIENQSMDLECTDDEVSC